MIKPICVKANNNPKGFEYRVLKRAMLRWDPFCKFINASDTGSLQGPRGQTGRAPSPCTARVRALRV